MMKPNIVVSKCLEFEKCRYNGQVIPDAFIQKLTNHVNFIPVCPEVEIGLGVPREPIRIVMENDKPVLYQPATGLDATEKMVTFTEQFLDSLKDVDGFILKNRSPSCGIADVKIYQSKEKTAMSERGPGFFGGAVKEKFNGLAIEDEGRLKNFSIREHFLTKLFALARFRQIKTKPSMGALVDFHTRNKLLLLAYQQAAYRRCGQIVANHEQKPLTDVIKNYENELHTVFAKQPRYQSIINTLEHAFGGISKNLSKEEKVFFTNSIEEFRDERIPLSVLVHLVRSYAVRFQSNYLLNQTFFNAYPIELTEITDSGKGRSY